MLFFWPTFFSYRNAFSKIQPMNYNMDSNFRFKIDFVFQFMFLTISGLEQTKTHVE